MARACVALATSTAEWDPPVDGRGFVDGLDWARLLANGWRSANLRAELLSAPIAATPDGAFSWAVVLCHELRQVERDGAGTDWAADARRLYLDQLAALQGMIAALSAH